MKDCIKLFDRICRDNGFSAKGRAYSRCIGDGIFQSIYIGTYDFVSCNSPQYKSGKKSRCIEIGMWSMYSNLPELYFSAPKHTGCFFPENFLGQQHNMKTFLGFEHELQLMEMHVFPSLNSILSQKELLDVVYSLQKAQYKEIIKNDVQLCAPHILCGETIAAINNLCWCYTQNWMAFHSVYDYLKRERDYEEYFRKEAERENQIRYSLEMLKMLWGSRTKDLKRELLVCLNRNIELAKSNRIAFGDNFSPLLKIDD